MSGLRRAAYALLALLAAATFALLLAWELTKYDPLLYLCLGCFAAFAVLFAALLVAAKKTGWKGERSLRGRVAAGGAFLLDLYDGEKKFRADVYPADRKKETLRLLKDAEREDETGELAAERLGDLCLGCVTFRKKELFRLGGKTFALSRETDGALRRDGAAKEFLASNEFFVY